MGLNKEKKDSQKQREGIVLSRCLEWLALNGFFAWRNNTGTAKIDMRFIRFGQPGSTDIICILPDGKFLGIECKTKNGKQLLPQQVFERQVKKNKGYYILARDPSDIIAFLKSEGYSIPNP